MSERRKHLWFRTREDARGFGEFIGSYEEPGYRPDHHGAVVYLVFSDEEASRIRALLKAGELPTHEIERDAVRSTRLP